MCAPPGRRDFAPNAMLEITPAFLDAALTRVRALGYRILSLDDALAELRDRRSRRGAAPFAVLTFDDGYRDNLIHAVPVLERAWGTLHDLRHDGLRRAHRTPLVGGAGGGDPPRRRASRLSSDRRRRLIAVRAGTAEPRSAPPSRPSTGRCGPAGRTGCWPWSGDLARGQGDRWHARSSSRPLHETGDEIERPWRAIRSATIGAHTLTHPRLARLGAAEMRTELGAARRAGSGRAARPRPVDPSRLSRGRSRARRAGASSRPPRPSATSAAVTTRPGLIHTQSMPHIPLALPARLGQRAVAGPSAPGGAALGRRLRAVEPRAGSSTWRESWQGDEHQTRGSPSGRSIQAINGSNGRIQARPSTA